MTSVEKTTRLSVLIARVDQGLAGVPGAEAALQEILTERLYPGDDFAAWCDQQWPRHRDTIRKLLGTSDVACLIAFPEEEAEALPQPTAAQDRELARLPADHVRSTWEAVVRGAQASGLKITRGLVRVAVNQTLKALEGAEPTPAEAKAAREELARRSHSELLAAAVKWGRKDLGKWEREIRVLPDEARSRIEPHLAAIRDELGRLA